MKKPDLLDLMPRPDNVIAATPQPSAAAAKSRSEAATTARKSKKGSVEWRAKMAEIARRSWQNPESRAKRIAGIKRAKAGGA